MSPKRHRLAVAFPAWAQMTEKRRAHVEGVAWLLSQWADAMAVPEGERARWLRMAALHDAVKDAPRAFLRELAPDAWGIDKLRHGPAAAVLAARHGETDRGVLDAVRYHSVGFAGWDWAGRLLYLADYLEPGRSHSGAADRDRRKRVPVDAHGVLCEVTRERLDYLRERGRTILRETREFWESLQCAG
jgi:HD superfamily phosphohydrolase YqeK